MADVTVQKNVLTLTAAFTDGDDRTITLDNPTAAIASGDSVASATIKDLSDFIRHNQVILGDKAKADFTRIGAAKVTKGTTVYFDLT